jgi:hypothetical protein
MIVLGIIWVGIWGFLFAYNPNLICRIFRRQETPRRLRNVRILGAAGLLLTVVSAVLEFALRN